MFFPYDLRRLYKQYSVCVIKRYKGMDVIILTKIQCSYSHVCIIYKSRKHKDKMQKPLSKTFDSQTDVLLFNLLVARKECEGIYHIPFKVSSPTVKGYVNHLHFCQ